MNDRRRSRQTGVKAHAAAVRLLEHYKTTGEPFALFLSSWQFDHAREIRFELEGSPRPVQVRIGLERQVRVFLKHNYDVETLAVFRRDDAPRIAAPDDWPSLTLNDDNWQERVTEAASLADLIVLFAGVSGQGVEFELDLCLKHHALKTVVISAAPLREIAGSMLPDQFSRVLWLEEIPPFSALHAEFDPLIERIKTIKAINPVERATLIDPETRAARVPFPPPSDRFGAGRWVQAGSPPWIKIESLRQAWETRWNAHQTTATPFVLYLKDPDWSRGNEEGIVGQNLIEFELLEGRPKGSEVIVPVPFGMRSDEWNALRRDMISRAEIIVLEVMNRSDDKLFEMRECIELGKLWQTVLIVPSSQSAFPPLDAERPVMMSPRVLWSDCTDNLMNTPVVAGLTKWLAQLAALPLESRQSYYANGEHLRRRPQFDDFKDVSRWYLKIAEDYLEQGDGLNLVDDSPIGSVNQVAWWGAFWHYVRAAKLASANSDASRGADQNSTQIATIGFLITAELLLRYEENDGEKSVIGDLDYALASARMGVHYAGKLANPATQQRALALVQEIMDRQRSLADASAPASEVWFELPLLGLEPPDGA